MSQRQASRRAARERWRIQAAKLVAQSGACGAGENASLAWTARVIERGRSFDVALVRAYCERLVADGERLEDERVVFAAWTEERGLGLMERHSGWPRKLAAEWSLSRGPAMLCRRAAAANGDSIARTARRLLDTLDGRCPWAPSTLAQASACVTCLHRGPVVRAPEWLDPICPYCRGTGHNLAGVLPAVEHPASRISVYVYGRRSQPARQHLTEISRLVGDGIVMPNEARRVLMGPT
jgi:hypothetical protein